MVGHSINMASWPLGYVLPYHPLAHRGRGGFEFANQFFGRAACSCEQPQPCVAGTSTDKLVAFSTLQPPFPTNLEVSMLPRYLR